MDGVNWDQEIQEPQRSSVCITSEHPYKSNIILYKFFIEDLFLIWEGDENGITEFTNHLNNNEWGTCLTLKYSVLEILMSQTEGKFITATFCKKVDANSFLDFHSGHCHKWKTNVPFGQFRHILKNWSEDETFERQSETILRRFLEKRYPWPLIECTKESQEFEPGTAYSQRKWKTSQKRRPDWISSKRSIPPIRG